MIDPMTEPHIVAIREELIDKATPISEAFRKAGYGTSPPGFEMRYNAQECTSTICLHSHTGAGGMLDAFVQLNGKNQCSVFVGEMYSLPPGRKWQELNEAGVLPPVTLKSTFPTDTPDLVDVLLREVRKIMLGNG